MAHTHCPGFPWLPDDWGQGIKSTNRTAHSRGTGGGTYTVLVSPSGKIFYHRKDAEKHDGKEWTLAAGFNGQVKLAKLQAMEAIQLARASIKESSKGGQIDVDSDKDLFAVLNSTERKFIPKKEEFHFCVVSARRATKIEGVRDIFMVQSQLLEAGVTPTWYVDEDSVADYKALGLKAVVGGKLTPSRNKALEDARRLNKVCVQVSDDISAWEYRDGEKAAARDDTLMNAAHAAAKRLIVSPVAAASFILAKMRGVPEDRKPKLGGVYMLGSCARTFCGEAFARKHFILGDFFVVDKGSSVNFDEKLTLKEDYDFACSHIRAHGGVMRCNRMTLNVKHYSNSGGAVTVRNNDSEKRNIQVLTGKWPNAFRANPKRKNEVIMRWPADDDAEGLKSSKKKGAKQASKKSVRSKKVSDKKKTAVKKTVAKKVQKVCADLPSGKAILTWTGKESKQEYISRRCKKVNGKAVQTVIGLLKLKDSSGAERTPDALGNKSWLASCVLCAADDPDVPQVHLLLCVFQNLGFHAWVLPNFHIDFCHSCLAGLVCLCAACGNRVVLPLQEECKR
ncbi:unnamed protein product [Polarella glacialis]|uniref:Uncharacterized protein n=1 Tax=Polarella glacialis TaxID=89957 RepID=A0A813LDU8_POLGL|nr:unnamed protein product [Polarella glacialis]